MWWGATRPVLVIGVAGALLAAIPGLVDLVTVVPKQNATKIGVADTAVVPEPGLPVELLLTLVGSGLIAASGWLSGMMVYEHHVGVLEHSNARNP